MENKLIENIDIQNELSIIEKYKKSNNDYDVLLCNRDGLIKTVINLQEAEKWLKYFFNILENVPVGKQAIIVYLLASGDRSILINPEYRQYANKLKIVIEKLNELPSWAIQRKINKKSWSEQTETHLL